MNRVAVGSLLSLALTVSPSRAQLVADGGSATLANVTTNITGTVTVGTNGSFTLLTLSDNALLINSLRGVIGQNATARSNEVRLISPTARWQPGITLTVGSNGSFNRLVISNGAQVVGTFLGNTAILGETAASSNNFALVTGAGSLWSNAASVNIGYFGARNQLVVSNGARIHSENHSYIGLASSSTNNRVTVNGAGSIWSSDGVMNLGLNGRGNALEVRAGGGLRFGAGFIGSGSGDGNLADLAGPGTFWTNTSEFHVGSDSSGNGLLVNNGAVVFAGTLGLIGRASVASLNTVTISDPGSMWVNGGDLYVGRDGPANRLFINNGGTVTASNLFIGVQPTSTSNRVVVTGSTLRVTNAAGTSVLDIRRGTNQLVSGLVEADRLVVTNTAGRFELLSGTLVTRGAFINNGSAMSVGQSGGGSAFWDARPGLSGHFVADVFVGNASSSNQLLVSSGALLTNSGNGVISLNSGDNFNSALVTDAGTSWQLNGFLYVGSNGANATLVVSNGALLKANAADIGRLTASGTNVAIVTGVGSTWSNINALTVGLSGSGNQLLVSDGGFVVNNNGSLGNVGSNNLALVTGAGSVWSNRGNLNIGVTGSNNVNNRLRIENGGKVFNQDATVGGLSGSRSNFVVVTGAGSLWNNRDVRIGPDGRDAVTVNDGGVVLSRNSYVGAQNLSAFNQATVTGSGSLWSNQLDLIVGGLGAGNALVVSNGGRMINSNGFVGGFDSTHLSASNNTAIVTGSGSSWSNRADLSVGFASSGNQVTARGGANVFVGGQATIGRDVNARSNSVLIADLGSAWLTSSDVYVGSNGSFNRLVVSNGGFASSQSGFVGFGFAASNNLALFTGPGSVWSASGVFVGNFSPDNQLIVSDGATLSSQGGYIGIGSSGNLALVTGPGSKWDNGQSLFLYYENNRLVVSNAALVMNDNGHIGVGDNNTATVTGAGSLWSNRVELTVGESGSANRLNIQSGGTVFGSKVFLGRGDTSFNNRVVVQGGTLRATNAAGTGLLDVRRGTNVLNSGLVAVDTLVVTNRGTFIPPVFLPVTFGNGSSNRFGGIPPASNGLSTVTVAGYAGSVTKVSVTLSNLSLGTPDDYHLLLVSPTGQRVMLMSDAGGIFGFANVRLDFEDTATTTLPDSSQILAGTYQPTDFEPGETLPSPAPAGPYSTTLSSFNGSSPNGVWSLYLVNQVDNGASCCGTLVGWSVQITTDAPTIEAKFVDPGVFELNGGTLITRGTAISNNLPFIVGGSGGVPASWEARTGLNDNFVARDLLVGVNSSFNQLVIPSGVVVAGTNVIVGASFASSNNLLHVNGGTLRVLNPGAALDVRGGTNRLDSGLVDVTRLVVTNTRGQFELNGGTLRTTDTIISNGRVFTIGGGANTATLQLLGGTHTFDDNLTVATNGSLIGTGVIDGTVTVAPGGRLVPGAPIGSIDVLGSVILQGTATLQIDKSGGVRTSDEVIADGAIFYNGTLSVIDIGSDVLSAGDKFFLFDATPYVGAFTTLNLAPLGAGLTWKNNLSVDGSIEVIVATQSQPKFSNVVRSGANLILSGTNGTPNSPYAVLTATNVTTPAANWQSLVTNQFGASGQFSFTNGTHPNEPQRYFRLRSP